jgi:hypothetical protein
MTFHMPDSYYDPPDPCCDDEDCDGDLCREREADERDDAMRDRADARREAGEDW